MRDNVWFSYLLLYLPKSDIIIAIKAKANKNMSINVYWGILDMHISNITVTAIRNIISVLFIKSPVNWFLGYGE